MSGSTKRDMSFLAVVISMLVLQGCALPPPKYSLAKDEPFATVNIGGFSSIRMCRNSELYTLVADGAAREPVGKLPPTNVVRIPSGERVSVGVFMSWQTGYQYILTESCSPYVSFLPEENGRYAVDFGVVGKRCYAEVVREDDATLTGLAPEPSIGPRDCFEATGAGQGKTGAR